MTRLHLQENEHAIAFLQDIRQTPQPSAKLISLQKLSAATREELDKMVKGFHAVRKMTGYALQHTGTLGLEPAKDNIGEDTEIFNKILSSEHVVKRRRVGDNANNGVSTLDDAA